ncbi:hypothetical protein [Burkholderia seminalis]|uniref:hypothetical protein n=1 Tax=Burkholderia seminalis TaxID=488731 RepID=UPI0012EAFDC0|nr:hypothetical protein [Burkholderia seminalis]MCA8043593.1 hypothetical protein [Burkholderia seminalis]
MESAAIEKFALSVTVPIFLEMGDWGGLLATGTLFKIDERAFLITARHIFDDVQDASKLAYPENPLRGGLYTFGSINILKPTEEHIDVAAIELLSPETVQRLNANWKFLGLANVASASMTTSDGSCFVSGYPESLTQNVQGWTKGKFVTAYTQRFHDVPPEARLPVIPDLDLFFDYSDEGTSITGETVQTPELPGVSGASIWELVSSTSSVWSPEAVTRVVGIQSAYVHSKYIRAKSWWAVAKVLEQADEQLAIAIRRKLN